jgi:hypothetical protein
VFAAPLVTQSSVAEKSGLSNLAEPAVLRPLSVPQAGREEPDSIAIGVGPVVAALSIDKRNDHDRRTWLVHWSVGLDEATARI